MWNLHFYSRSYIFQSCNFQSRVFSPAFSGPAFSTPAFWSRIFRSCIFHSCIFGPAFASPAFSGPSFSGLAISPHRDDRGPISLAGPGPPSTLRRLCHLTIDVRTVCRVWFGISKIKVLIAKRKVPGTISPLMPNVRWFCTHWVWHLYSLQNVSATA